jgi:hypothetical protein
LTIQPAKAKARAKGSSKEKPKGFVEQVSVINGFDLIRS